MRQPGRADASWRHRLHVTEPDTVRVRAHLAELARLPRPVGRALRAAGAEVWIGDRPITELDSLGWLAGEQPPGASIPLRWVSNDYRRRRPEGST